MDYRPGLNRSDTLVQLVYAEPRSTAKNNNQSCADGYFLPRFHLSQRIEFTEEWRTTHIKFLCLFSTAASHKMFRRGGKLPGAEVQPVWFGQHRQLL